MKRIIYTLVIVVFFFSQAANAEVCGQKYKDSPQQFIKFIDKYIGKENLFNNNYTTLGLTSRYCPHSSNSICKKNSWGKFARNRYHYPIINGLYYVYPEDEPFPREMRFGKILDDRYFLEDVKNAIEEQIGICPDKRTMLNREESHYCYIGNAGEGKYKIYGRYIQLTIDVYGLRDEPRGPKVTTIDYSIRNETEYVNTCIKRKQYERKVREKGQNLRLN